MRFSPKDLPVLEATPEVETEPRATDGAVQGAVAGHPGSPWMPIEVVPVALRVGPA